jgi:hypothetical protein
MWLMLAATRWCHMDALIVWHVVSASGLFAADPTKELGYSSGKKISSLLHAQSSLSIARDSFDVLRASPRVVAYGQSQMANCTEEWRALRIASRTADRYCWQK